MTTNGPNKRSHPARRVFKWIGVVVGVVIGLLAVAVLLFLIPGVRESLLSVALSRANASLPGHIQIGRLSWPSPGALELRDVLWTDEANTLLSADLCSISVALKPLVRREIEVDHVTAKNIVADVPAIRERFPTHDQPPAQESSKENFLREGSMPGLPSISVDRIFVTASSIRLDAENELTEFVLDGACDLSRGHSPSVRIDQLIVHEPNDIWGVDSLSFDIDLGRGTLAGQGNGRLGPQWPVYFVAGPRGSDTVSFTLVTGKAVRDSIGIVALASIERQGLSVESVQFDASIRTPGTADLSTLPALGFFAELPALDGVSLTTRGTLQFHPQFAAQVSCDLRPNGWLDGGHVECEYDSDALVVKTAEFDLTDLSLRGDAMLGPDTIATEIELQLNGVRTFGQFLPDMEVPLGLTAAAHLRAILDKKNQNLDVTVDANGKTDDLSLDKLHLSTRFALDKSEPSTAVVVAGAMGINLGVSARIERDNDINVHLAPILVSNRAIDVAELSAPSQQSRFRFSPSDGALAARNIRVESTAGVIRLDAELDSILAGEYALSCRWPHPPELLLDILDLPPEQTDSLRALWRDGGDPQLDITGSTTGGDQRKTSTHGLFAVPGPRVLAAILPDSAHVGDLGSIKGNFTLITQSDPDGTSLDFTAALDSTTWIRSSQMHVSRSQNVTRIDTVAIATDGLVIGIGGVVDATFLDLRGEITINDSLLVRRFVPNAPLVRLSAGATLAGTPDKPRLDVLIDASIDGDAYHVPQLLARANTSDHGALIQLDAPRGVITTVATLDSVSVDLETIGDSLSLVPVRLSLEGGGKGVFFSQSMVVDTTDGLKFSVDDLNLVVAGQDLTSQRSFKIMKQANEITIENVDLAGSLGVVSAHGMISQDATDLNCDIAIELPPKPSSLNLPDPMWPERFALRVGAKDQEVSATANVRGFELAHGLRSTLDVSVVGSADSVRMDIAIADSVRSLLEATTTIPANITVYPPDLEVVDGPMYLDVTINRYPFALYPLRAGTEIPEGEVSRINGKIAVGGTTSAPVGHASASISFPDWPKISVFELALEASMGNHTDGQLVPHALDVIPDASRSNLVAAFSLNENGKRIAFGAVGHPVIVTLDSLVTRTPAEEPMFGFVRADSLPLDRFDPILPTDVSVQGSCKIDLAIDGAAGDPNVHGDIVASGLRLAVAEQARITAEGVVDIAGTASAPVVKGDIRVKSGLIQIPEEIQNLYPTNGESYLLDDPSRPSHDGTQPEPTEKKLDVITPDDAGEFDVTIGIPNRFYVRGRGLDLELAGDLHIVKKQEKPVVTGELRVIQGTFIFLGRSLMLERGTVTFFGEDEINPALDIVLATRVDDVTIKILVGGTAKKPELLLTSEPFMQEPDIISTLLFGASFDDLNDGQADLVERRTTEMVAALGAAQLQKNLSGVDVVSFKGADSQNEAGTLTVGKYLNPNVLLSYVYAIDNQAASFVSLEYFLKGNFRVDTVYGNRNQTGLGFGWAKDY